MRSTVGLRLVAGIVLTGLALSPSGCSSTEPPVHEAGAQGGNGDAASDNGDSADAGATCQSLIADYAAAFHAATSCSPLLSIVQCAQVASASVQCPGCETHVNDTTHLDAIRAAFQARTDCAVLPCPAFSCPFAGVAGACQANDAGAAGTCINVY